MASEKKPSIYNDRSAIGSSAELDEYGVWVKSEPQDVSTADAAADTAVSLGMDAESPEEAALSLPNPDPGDDGTLNLADLNVPAESFNTDFADLAMAEPLPEAADSPAEEGSTEISLEDFPGDAADTFVDTSADTPDTGADDSLPELPGGEPRPKLPSGKQDSAELSTQLLLKIADELSSIRSELSTLKNELSIIHPEGGFGQHYNEKADHGFFDEKEDENIALTGEELDGLINTADFTEEAGTAAPKDSAIGIADDILPDLGGDIGEAEEKIPLEAASGDLTLTPQPGSDGSEDSLLLNEVNLSPDDEAALNEFALTDESLDGDAFDENFADLSNTIIDEPDLGAEIQESPGNEPSGDSEKASEEPSLDDISLDEEFASGVGFPEGSLDQSPPPETPVSIDLDLEESAEELDTDSGDAAVNDEEELAFSIPEFTAEAGFPEESLDQGSPQEEENFAQVIPEGFVVEGEDAPVLDDEELDAEIPDAAPPEPAAEAVSSPPEPAAETEGPGSPPVTGDIPGPFKQELKTVLSYMDQLLESLPEDKIEEFAKSEYFDTYKKLFKELGIV
ncbi:hypothetical protein AGMMS49587_04150 [Spirochaetia bacterium]|nr:hypothetical protein AGMMS49587_04150 [Spirochaetia bacterium]